MSMGSSTLRVARLVEPAIWMFAASFTFTLQMSFKVKTFLPGNSVGHKSRRPPRLPWCPSWCDKVSDWFDDTDMALIWHWYGDTWRAWLSCDPGGTWQCSRRSCCWTKMSPSWEQLLSPVLCCSFYLRQELPGWPRWWQPTSYSLSVTSVTQIRHILQPQSNYQPSVATANLAPLKGSPAAPPHYQLW